MAQFQKKDPSKISTVRPTEKIPAATNSPSTQPLNGSAAGAPPVKVSPPQAPQSAFEKVAPAAAFPVDPLPEQKRGPGRPAKISIAPAAQAPAPVILISDESVKGLIGMVSNLAAYSFSLSTGAPVEALSKVWTFTEGEKVMLAPPAAELINKNAPEWMKKYETEIKLAMIAVPILISKLAMTHAVVKMHKENQKNNELTPSPTVATPAQSGDATRRAAA